MFIMHTTRKVLAGPILLAQCFGLLPVIHVIKNHQVAFQWKSFRFIHAIAILVLFLTNLAFYIARVADEGLNFPDTVTLLFFAYGPIVSLIFIKLATIWPDIMTEWEAVDYKMAVDYNFPITLHRKVLIVSILVMGASSVEHGFFLLFSVTTSSAVKNATTILEGMNGYFRNTGSHVFNHLPYHLILGFLIKFGDTAITFAWNFMDLFIMIVAMSIAARFKQINTRIQIIIEEVNQINYDLRIRRNVDTNIWKNIREDYYNMYSLAGNIDIALGHMILISFANNLFIILVQLLHSLEPAGNTDIVDRLYFVYSFGFLISRTCAVALTSAQIHYESRQPAWQLSTRLPNEHYTEEVERLLVQIKASNGCCLTGNGFFKVTSSLILSIAGAIVTYELILIQFNV